MMEQKDTLERTRCALERHLEDLMDETDQNGGRISSRKVLIGIHDVLDSMSHLEMLTKGSESEAVAAKASGISVKSTL